MGGDRFVEGDAGYGEVGLGAVVTAENVCAVFEAEGEPVCYSSVVGHDALRGRDYCPFV
jgi:hypothetical protein